MDVYSMYTVIPLCFRAPTVIITVLYCTVLPSTLEPSGCSLSTVTFCLLICILIIMKFFENINPL